jgi:hypothetical protein
MGILLRRSLITEDTYPLVVQFDGQLRMPIAHQLLNNTTVDC